MKYENIYEIIAKNPKLKDLDQETMDLFNEMSDDVLHSIVNGTFSNNAFPDTKIIKEFAIDKGRTSSNGLLEKVMIGDVEYKYRNFDVKVSIFPGNVKIGLDLKQRNKGKLVGKTHSYDFDLNEMGVSKLKSKIKFKSFLETLIIIYQKLLNKS